MASSSKSDTIASTLGKLSIETSSSKEKAPRAVKEKRAPVADSWEDEDVSSGSEPEEEDDDDTAGAPRADREARSGTSAPPPTPMTSTYNDAVLSMNSQSIPGSVAPGRASEVKRPEKTDAVARRMIASALGVKVPRLTEDQKKYDQAVREKERRRRAEEKERLKREEEEALKAKQAVWED